MNYKLIYRTFGEPRRGANITSHQLRDIDTRIKLYDIDNIQSIQSIREQGSVLVFMTQAIHLYNKKFNFLKSKPSDVVYIRQERSPKLYNNPVNNGFSYTLIRERGDKNHIRNNDYKFYSPDFYNFKIPNHDKIGRVLGYYLRPVLTPDSTNWFLEFLNNLQEPIDIYTMGDYVSFQHHPNVLSQIHTYDRFEFFTKVTHYIYFKSGTFKDPFPHSLMEAVQSNCQIIVPNNTRHFDDGIDDILSCIDHHTTLNNEIIDNSCSLLCKDFTKYNKELIDKGFCFTGIKELHEYKDMKEWMIENIR